MLENSGVDIEKLDNPDSYLSMKQVCDILRQGNELLDDPSASFEFGRELDLQCHGLFGFALLRQQDFPKLINMVVQYLRVSLPLMDMEISCQAGLISIQLHDNWDLGDLKPTITNIYMGSIYSLASLVCRKFTFEFDFPHPGRSPNWQQLSNGVEALFNRPANRVLMPLSARQARNDEASMAGFLASARSREQLNKDDSLRVASRVRQQIISAPGRNSSLERVAEGLGMSPRSVRRHLSLAGYSFSTIRNEVRETFATRFLEDTDMPLGKIAEHMGYSDQASFSKAYRGWTGKTPGEVRRAQRQ
ncbi:AraC family transcriptional regulator [Alcanivorax sp. S6407]|nr:AraC family transcriptional regulator [Alcanivorax sp. S6407]